MAYTDLDSVDSWKKFEADNKGKILVYYFWAPWSEACNQLGEILEELWKEVGAEELKLARIEAEEVAEVSMDFDILAVPTLVFSKDGKKFDRIDGMYPAELTKKVRLYKAGLLLAPSPNPQLHSAPTSSALPPKQDLKTRLGKLTSAHKCMVFMKGDPDSPQCGFSAQLMKILKNMNADFKTFDILSDEEVRQGLKEHSNWPTYPQVYVDGELIGGLDIIKEMEETGDLTATLPVKQSINERLKALINKEPVMIFMKGVPEQPRCKFSKALMEILRNVKTKFGTFDILEDNDVRENLKTFSNWPTYPQVYVKGELIGGIDIIKELAESGELEDTLSSASS